MKLHQLPHGARFEYQGKIFTKVGPLTAAATEGGLQLVPRYAELQPLDALPPQVTADAARSVTVASVRAAFELFCQRCAPLLGDADQAEFSAARENFLASLR